MSPLTMKPLFLALALVAVSVAVFFLLGRDGLDPRGGVSAQPAARGPQGAPTFDALEELGAEDASAAVPPEEEPRRASRGLPEPYLALSKSFPEIADLHQPDSIVLEPGAQTEHSSLDVDQVTRIFWWGTTDEDGQRVGWWLKSKDRGPVIEAVRYESGVRVGPAIRYHENGRMMAYYRKLGDHGGVQGPGWWWHEDGTPRGAGTFDASMRTGPWVEFAPDGQVDWEKTRDY